MPRGQSGSWPRKKNSIQEWRYRIPVRHITKQQPTSATVGSQDSREFSSIQAVIAISLVCAFHRNDRLGGFYFPSWPSKRREAIEKAHMPSSHGPLNALAFILPRR
jgi:hypothetical protein